MTVTPMDLTSIKLNNGLEMPRLHLGVYMAELGRETEDAVKWALEAGYQGIDSAEWYGNEAECGRAITSFLKSTGQERKKIWFTSKLKTNIGYEATRKTIKSSLRKTGLKYIDLYLLHSPYGGKMKRLECWKALEDAVREGEVKAIGVSNYGIRHLQELLDSSPRIVPCVNQIEVHPFNTRESLTAYCKEKGIVVEAWAPLARAMRMQHPTLVATSGKYAKTPAQVLIQWSIQLGYVPLPKSVSKERIVTNGQVGDFEISGDEMAMLNGLDEYLVTDWDPIGRDNMGNINV